MAYFEIPIKFNIPDEQLEQAVKKAIESAPDYVCVIRCKDCKWFGKAGCAIHIVDDSDKPSENDYCSFAERASNEG